MRWSLLLIVLLTACSDAGAPIDSPVPYFVDDVAWRSREAPTALAEAPMAWLRGVDGPVALGLPDGRVVYSAYAEEVAVDPMRTEREQGIGEGTVLGRPSVRVSDADGDRLLVDGAIAPAVSPSGRVAVGVLDDPDYRHERPLDAAVAVVEPGAGTPVRWTGSGGLRSPLAWVGDALLYAVPQAPRLPELRAATGPGRDVRVAAAATFVAASPDGRLVLVAAETPGGGERLTFEIRSVVDGSVAARVPSDLRWVGPGRWGTDGRITVAGAPSPGALVAVEFGEDLRTRRTVEFAVPDSLASPPMEVAFTADGREFAVSTFDTGTRFPNTRWTIMRCVIDTAACARNDLPAGVVTVGFLGNPSV